MKAVVLEGYGGIDQLKYKDVPEPKAGPGEVLVRVAATSINPVDWKLRSGSMKDRMPLELPAILGRDVGGTVVSGDGFEAGARVMGLVNHAYAEFLVAKREVLTEAPARLDLVNAAALPLVLTTGCQLIEKAVQPKPGWTVLVTGALGSVGRAAVFVARQHGAKVLAGVRGREREEAEKLGADRVVAIDEDASVAAMGEVDAIADTVGGATTEKLLPYLRASGVLGSVVGAPKGAEGKPFAVRMMMAEPDAKRLHELAEAVANGELKIPIAGRVPLAHAAEAQDRAERGEVKGKVLLVC